MSQGARRKNSDGHADSSGTSTAAGWSDVCACALEDFVTVPPAAGPLTSSPQQQQQQPPRRGVLRYVGPVGFADGLWAGVELVGTLGRNDGSVKGIRYFACLPGQGLFVRPEHVRPYTGAEPDEAPHSAAENEQAQKSLEAANESTAALRKSLDAARSRTIELEMEVDDLSAQLAQLKRTTSTTASAPTTAAASPQPLPLSERIQLEMDIMELKDTLEATERALHTAESTIVQLRKAAAVAAPAATDPTSAQCTALETVQSRLSAKERECEQLRHDLADARTAHASVDTPVHEVGDGVLTQKISALEHEKARLAADMETLWAEAAAAETASAAKIEAATTAHRQDEDAWRQQRAALEAAQEALRLQVVDLTQRLITQSEAQAVSAVSVEVAVQRCREEWEAKFRESEAATKELHEILELTEHELLEEKKQTDQLSEVVSRLRDDIQSAASNRNEQISALEVQNQRQSQELLQAQHTVQVLQTQLQSALAARQDSGGVTTTVNDADNSARNTASSQASAQEDVDALKHRLFQLQKEKEADAQLRVRFDALTKELTAVKVDSRQQLEKLRAQHAATEAQSAEACAALQARVEQLQSGAVAQEAAQQAASIAATNAFIANSLDAKERRSYQQLLARSLQAAENVQGSSAVSLTLPLVGGCRCIADSPLSTHSVFVEGNDTAQSMAQQVVQFNVAMSAWKEKAAQSCAVGGVLDFTTPESRRLAISALFNA